MRGFCQRETVLIDALAEVMSKTMDAGLLEMRLESRRRLQDGGDLRSSALRCGASKGRSNAASFEAIASEWHSLKATSWLPA